MHISCGNSLFGAFVLILNMILAIVMAQGMGRVRTSLYCGEIQTSYPREYANANGNLTTNECHCFRLSANSFPFSVTSPSNEVMQS